MIFKNSFGSFWRNFANRDWSSAIRSLRRLIFRIIRDFRASFDFFVRRYQIFELVFCIPHFLRQSGHILVSESSDNGFDINDESFTCSTTLFNAIVMSSLSPSRSGSTRWGHVVKKPIRHLERRVFESFSASPSRTSFGVRDRQPCVVRSNPLRHVFWTSRAIESTSFANRVPTENSSRSARRSRSLPMAALSASVRARWLDSGERIVM